MKKEPLRWEPERVSGMTNEEILEKLKELVPVFDLNSFVSKTQKYLSCEDLTEEEYYPHATFSDEDEDFIWMACEELWKRLVPDKPVVELVAGQVDSLIEEIIKAGEKNRWNDVFRRSREAIDLICRHTIEETSTGRMVRREFYEKLRKTTLYDFDSFLDDLMHNLIEHEEYEKVIGIAGTLAEGLDDDVFLDFKAESLFGLGRKDEGERLYQEIISRDPDNPWVPLHAGDCCLDYGEKDFPKARDYYLKALGIAQKHVMGPDGRDELRAVYERLIDVAHETDDSKMAEHYERLLDSLDAKKVGRNEPCPCGSGKKYKKCCGRSEAGEAAPPPLDRRLMERSLLGVQQLVSRQGLDSVDEINQYLDRVMKDGNAPQWIPETPLERAQNMVFEALERSGKERFKLINQALKTSPDCADAYVLLAEEKAQSVEEALSLYAAGVKAGERTLGDKIFQEGVGEFWGMIETRPYMRARNGLAQCLWELGKHDEALEHYRDMLRLNPNDNQGIRYVLASCLLKLDEINALHELLERYDEATADWLYTRALAAFLQQGDSSEVRQLLLEAMEHNRYVIPYLLGEKRLPGRLPERVGFGDESEAVVYAAEFGRGWIKAKGAISWLISVCRNEQTILQEQSGTLNVPEAFIHAFESGDKKQQPAKDNLVEIYTFKVSLKESPNVWRKIEIKGSQNLHSLHRVIFKAYERYDEHLYAFFLSNKPWDNSAEYGPPDQEGKVKNDRRARIDSLGLSVNKRFLYLFDFGDEWWHSIGLLDIKNQEPKGKYPRIIESHGEAPTQYADYDEDDN